MTEKEIRAECAALRAELAAARAELLELTDKSHLLENQRDVARADVATLRAALQAIITRISTSSNSGSALSAIARDALAATQDPALVAEKPAPRP